MKQALTREQAMDKIKGCRYAVITRLSEMTVGPAPEAFSLDELVEARFFDEQKEIHICRTGDDWEFYLAYEQLDEDFIDVKSTLEVYGSKLYSRRQIEYDDDGQAYISCVRLAGWEA